MPSSTSNLTTETTPSSTVSAPGATITPPPGNSPPGGSLLSKWSINDSFESSAESLFGTILTSVATGLCTYHGYRRNNSLGWGLAWGFLGSLFPVIAPAVAFAQGLGEPKNQQVRLAALGTNEFTEYLEPHVRALCVVAVVPKNERSEND